MADAASEIVPPKKNMWPYRFLVALSVPIVAVAIIYRLETLDPSPLPIRRDSTQRVVPPFVNDGRMLQSSDLIGEGTLVGPEDMAYDSESSFLYTGCLDGWIKRVTVTESAEESVEKWVRLGGRPLGLALGQNNELIVAHPERGLLNVGREKEVSTLTKESEGIEFKLTDGVDVAEDGMIYFTDASFKYNFSNYMFDLLEGIPHGRLLSYDPSTNLTATLLSDLYFANGVAVSPDQNSVIFCESIAFQCRRYYVKGEKKGMVDEFIENMPGMPDNIRHDGDGRYWIGLITENTWLLDMAYKYPSLRKMGMILERYKIQPKMFKNGGVLAVDLEGKAIAQFRDPKLSVISSGMKIGNHLYVGSVHNPHLIRYNLTLHNLQHAHL